MALQGDHLPFDTCCSSPLSSFLIFSPAKYLCIESDIWRHKQNNSKPSLNLILFPRAVVSLPLSFPANAPSCKYAAVTQIGGIHRYTRVHTVCEKVSLMESEDSNFPSATKDRKPSELNYPCLTHIQTGQHTHTRTLTPSLVIIETHTSMHTLSCCDIPQNRAITVTRAKCEEYLSKEDFM